MVSIQFDHISRTFGFTAAVREVSLTIPAGELFFLLGPSGCGKTTLLRMLAGLTAPTAGRILFDGRDVTGVPAHLRETAMVFQSYALWPHMTVAENVAFGLEVRRIGGEQRKSRIAEALARVQMQEFAQRKPAQLSGGQQQRVALARALAVRPRCLLFDEPLSNLDTQLRLHMRSEIRQVVKEAGTTAVYVTHDQKEALSMADRIGVMTQGELVQVGAPAEVYRRPATRFVAGFIGESNFLPATVESVENGRVNLATAAGMLVAELAANVAAPALRSAVTLAIRPESVKVNAAAGAANRLLAQRVATAYSGEIAEHQMTLGGVPIKAYELNPRMAAYEGKGETVPVAVNPDNIMILPG